MYLNVSSFKTLQTAIAYQDVEVLKLKLSQQAGAKKECSSSNRFNELLNSLTHQPRHLTGRIIL